MAPANPQSRLFSYTPRRRHFTLDQANRALVLIRRVVGDIIIEYQQLLDFSEAAEAAAAAGKTAQIEDCHDKVVDAVDRLQICLEELSDIGVELRDWGLGVVDFPAIAGGREIYFCWQFGEPRVLYWHEVNAGDAGRQSIESLPTARTVGIR